MKLTTLTSLQILMFLPILVLSAEVSSNYPLYSLENVSEYQISENEDILFTFDKTEVGIIFDRRDITTGVSSLHKQLDMPLPFFMKTVRVGQDIYLFHAVILDRAKRLAETSIYKIDGSSGQAELVFNTREKSAFGERLYATRKGLLLTEKRGNNPFFFNIKSKTMKPIDLEDDFRVRAFDRGRDCAIIIRQTNFNTNFEGNDKRSSYTEGDGSLLDVYYCDFSDDFKLQKVGQYQPSYVISEDEAEAFLPHFIIEDDQYSWVEKSFMVNRYPVYPAGLIGDSRLYSTWESLVNHEFLTAITFSASRYAVASRYSEAGTYLLDVFDLENPKLERTQTVSLEDRKLIKALLQKNLTIEKRLIDPEVMSEIFDARFYEISLVTTEVDSSDGGISTSSSTTRFLAMSHDGIYSVLKKNQQLLPLVNDDFILNEGSALQFQNALDGLYPLGHFEEKHKAFHMKDGYWEFVRDESFGELEGIKVSVDDDGRITAIGAEGPFSEQ